MKNILQENMRRFATKNLTEQDLDRNNNGYPDDTEGNSRGRGHSIQISGPRILERFFSDDYIAALKNQKGEEATIFKHPNDNDYYVIVNIPYNKRDFSSFYYEIEADSLDELKMELIKNEFMLPTENIEQFVIDGNII